MKLATFHQEGRDRVGALTADGTQLVDLAAAAGPGRAAPFASMLALIEAGDDALDAARVIAEDSARSGDHLVPLSTAALRAPLPVPAQIRDFSLFPKHIVQSRRGMGAIAPDILGHPLPGGDTNAPPSFDRVPPAYYLSNRFSVSGPDDLIRWPDYSTYIDFELEIAAIIGKRGRDISEADASAHIFGYTIYNDFSARDTQLIEMGGMLGPTKGKSFDGGNALGPVIVTCDEIPDVRALRARAFINGEIWTDETLDEMLMSFEQVIAFVSRSETLHPGEVIGSGTVGNGCGLEHGRFLKDGDLVELEIEPIGTLRNRVARDLA